MSTPLAYLRRWLLATVLLAGCGGGNDRAEPEVFDLNAADAPSVDAAYAAYMAERGEDLAACFREDILLEGRAADPAFDDGVGDAEAPPVRRLVVAVDASGSMAADAGGRSKMAAAQEAVAAFLTGVPEDVQVGLVAFGHRGTNDAAGKDVSCAGVETVYAVGDVDEQRIRERVRSFDATGWTPLAAAIEQAGAQLQASDVPGEQVVYAVSDGQETCGGDPVAAARTLHRSDVKAVINIIGFDLPADERAQLRAVAEAGGGTFTEVRSADEMLQAAADAGRQVRNRGEIARTRVTTGGRSARNTVRTSGAVARVSLCVQGAKARENVGVASFFGVDYPHTEVVEGLRERLAQRHARYEQMLADYETAAEADLEEANRALSEQLREAEQAYEQVRPDNE